MKKMGNQACASCGETRKCRQREFSPEAWAVLMHWEAIESEAVAQPICELCYDDLREILIDRSAEVERVLASGEVSKQVAVPVLTAMKAGVSDQMVG